MVTRQAVRTLASFNFGIEMLGATLPLGLSRQAAPALKPLEAVAGQQLVQRINDGRLGHVRGRVRDLLPQQRRHASP